MDMLSNVWSYLGSFVGDASFAPVQMTEPISAIIIGINKYASPDVKDLEGPVPDALAVKKYLEEELGFPESRIRLLCDARATRKNIIQEFNNLVDHEHPDHGAPILIFYAGHGSEAKAPKGWKGGSKIQMLLPHDFRTIVSGKEINGIPDRTIGALLSQVAGKWGNNITVIFDSCHSGSGTRGDAVSSFTARFTEIPHNYAVPSDLDRKIWESWDGAQGGTCGAARAPSFLYRNQSSHIFLAACKKEEVAYEQRGIIRQGEVNGIFTAALLNRLYTVRGQNITYAGLFQQLPSLLVPTTQTPQCLGVNRNRVLFDAKVQGRVLFEVKRVSDNYVMDAGVARGIDVGDEFALYGDPHPPRKSPPLGMFVVHEADPFKSMITLLPGTREIQLDTPGFALRTKTGPKQSLGVYLADTKLTSTFEALVKVQDGRPYRPRILQVKREAAKLGIGIVENRAVFDVLDERVTTFHPLRIPSSVQLDVGKLHPILDAAAHFYWHLNRTGENYNLQNMVRLEFTEVKQLKGYYGDLSPKIEPIGQNLNQNGVIELIAADRAMHGINIVNDSAASLYVSLFYFDVSNLSITSFYQPPFAGKNKVDPPLPPKGSITLGYGPGGGTPKIYKLNEGQDVDVGFLKLFLSTEYVDLSYIPQPTPFTSDQKRVAESAERFIEPISLWDTILITLVIRKK